MADIDVIMPAWRSAATIGRALASIAAQTVPPARVIVCDDGSDDHTCEVAESWRDRLGGAELVLLRQPNQGAGAARNRCLSAAKAELVAFLDADDEWLPAKLERSLAHLTPDLAFVSHDMLIDDRRVDCARHFAADPFTALFLRGFVATSTVVARRQWVMEAGGFDPGIEAGQDYDLWLTLAAKRPFLTFAEALTRYHVTPDSITSRVEARRQGSLRILARHRPSLKGRAAMWKVAALRAAIIHYEALSAWRARGQWGKAAATLLAAGPAILCAALGPRAIAPLAWAWVAIALAAYLAQFQDIVVNVFLR